MVRNSLKFVPWKQRKEVARDLRTIYQAASSEQAEQALMDFSEKWDGKYPMISQSWWRHWANLTTFFNFPPEIRKVIYTTNAVESLNSSFRKVLKPKALSPTTKPSSSSFTWPSKTLPRNGLVLSPTGLWPSTSSPFCSPTDCPLPSKSLAVYTILLTYPLRKKSASVSTEPLRLEYTSCGPIPKF